MANIDFGSSPSLKQLAYEHLKKRIIQGDLKPGTWLREEKLAEEMNISRAPIREALNMLERDGFAEIVARKGAVVSGIMKDDIFYIWEMREVLESYAAKVSVGKIPEARLREVHLQLDNVLAHSQDMEAYMESDLVVHGLFSDYLENRFLRNSLKSLREHSLRLRWCAEYNDSELQADIVAAATEEHMQIIDAFQEKNKEKVFRMVRNHVKKSAKRLVQGA